MTFSFIIPTNSKWVEVFGTSRDASRVQLLFAANVRRIRKEKQLTQEQVAEYADLHTNYISSVERGERNISICNIERIARALGVPMPELLSPPPLEDESVVPGDAHRGRPQT